MINYREHYSMNGSSLLESFLKIENVPFKPRNMPSKEVTNIVLFLQIFQLLKKIFFFILKHIDKLMNLYFLTLLMAPIEPSLKNENHIYSKATITLILKEAIVGHKDLQDKN